MSSPDCLLEYFVQHPVVFCFSSMNKTLMLKYIYSTKSSILMNKVHFLNLPVFSFHVSCHVAGIMSYGSVKMSFTVLDITLCCFSTGKILIADTFSNSQMLF